MSAPQFVFQPTPIVQGQIKLREWNTIRDHINSAMMTASSRALQSVDMEIEVLDFRDEARQQRFT